MLGLNGGLPSLEIVLDRSKCHFWIVFSSINLLHLFCLCMRGGGYSSDDLKFTLVDILVWLVDVSFVNVCLFVKKESWREMAVGMKERHEMLQKRGDGNLSIARRPYWMLIIFFSMFSFDTWYYCTDPLRRQMFIKYICLRTTKVFKIVSTGLMYSTLNVLKGQVEVLKDKICKVRTKEELDQLSMIHLSLHKSIKSFNDCFGWHLFLLFCSFGLSVLMYLSIFASISFHTLTTRGAVAISLSVTYVLFDAVMILRLIFPAEVLYRFPQDLDKACHMVILTQLLETPLKNEFMWFSQSIKVLNTTISASEFFYINKRLMLSIVSVTTSYFIVYLQMKKFKLGN